MSGKLVDVVQFLKREENADRLKLLFFSIVWFRYIGFRVEERYLDILEDLFTS